MTDDFHERRRTGIGGSDAAAALGISPWRTPYDLRVEKVNYTGSLPITMVEPQQTEPMRWGTLMQPVIMGEYIRRTRNMVHEEPEMLRHSEHKWMLAHLDGRVVDLEQDRIVEIKTARDARGWGEPGSDEIPLHYLVQCHHYLAVSGATIADLAVLLGGSDFRIYTIHADDVIAQQLIDREAEFWRQVERREPPDPVNLHDAVSRWGRLLIEGAVEADAYELDAIESLRRFREQRKALEEAEEQAKVVVMQALGERGDTLVDANGTRLASWALDKGRRGYTVEAREPARRFLLK
jgi:putative phage-type endonuclease